MKKFLGAAVALVLVGVGLWFLILKGDPVESPKASCVILVDRTRSSDDLDMLDRYGRAGESAIDGCADKHANLSIYYFSNEDSKLLAPPDNQPFALHRTKPKVPGKGKKELEGRMDSAKGTLSTVLNTPSGYGRLSDIVKAVDLASQELQGMRKQEKDVPGYLLVLTDGVQNSGSVDLRSWMKGSNPDVTSLIGALQSSSELADLEDVSVSFVGVGDGNKLSNSQENAIKSFWNAFVEKSGGKMCAYLPSTTKANDLPRGC